MYVSVSRYVYELKFVYICIDHTIQLRYTDILYTEGGGGVAMNGWIDGWMNESMVYYICVIKWCVISTWREGERKRGEREMLL